MGRVECTDGTRRYCKLQRSNMTARAGRRSAQHRKAAILGWLALVVAEVMLGRDGLLSQTPRRFGHLDEFSFERRS